MNQKPKASRLVVDALDLRNGVEAPAPGDGAGHMRLQVLQEMPGLVGEVHQEGWKDSGIMVLHQCVLAVGAEAQVATDGERVVALVIAAHTAFHAHRPLRRVLLLRLWLLLLGDGGIFVAFDATRLHSIKQRLRQCL